MTASTDNDLTDELTARVREAASTKTPLRVVGGDTKRFYGREVQATALALDRHTGIVHYDPAELVVTVRAGTRLADLEAELQRRGQRLPFEPPAFGDDATIGGTVASGLAGPTRVHRGAVRDFVLGARLLTGDGRVLRFGGEVMKNVAGYDVARLLAGSLGILGIVLEVSLKVLPIAIGTRTLVQHISAHAAVERLATALQRGVPVTGSHWHDGVLHVRLEGSAAALETVAADIGGDALDAGAALRWWHDVREQRLAHFDAVSNPLWRLHVSAVAPTSPFERLAGFAFEWNGTQRWLTGVDAATVQRLARDAGGHATLLRGAEPGAEVFAPLSPAALALHRRLKQVFDPAGILNPGRMYAAL